MYIVLGSFDWIAIQDTELTGKLVGIYVQAVFPMPPVVDRHNPEPALPIHNSFVSKGFIAMHKLLPAIFDGPIEFHFDKFRNVLFELDFLSN